jgi:GTP cyclohydrolase-4
MGEEISLPPTPDLESLAERIALQIARRQEAASSEVHIRAQFLVRQETPLSSRRSDELYTFLGYAASDGVTVRRAAGVEVDGLTACPCAQDMVRGAALARLREAGYAPEEAERIVSLVPLATHNQRGRGTLILGCDPKIPAEHLVAGVEAAMSSETYELLKRPDEFFVVEKAHRRPRFVEDVVREMLRHVVEAFPDLPDDTFVLARQENLESIHQHNAFAEASALLGSLRRELAGGPPASGPSLEGWLRG